jgi:hypothetical protein
MGNKSYESNSEEILLKRKKTLTAVLLAVLTIFVIYLAYFLYRQLYLQLEPEPVLLICLLVIVGGMLPATVQLSAIQGELKKRKASV